MKNNFSEDQAVKNHKAAMNSYNKYKSVKDFYDKHENAAKGVDWSKYLPNVDTAVYQLDISEQVKRVTAPDPAYLKAIKDIGRSSKMLEVARYLSSKTVPISDHLKKVYVDKSIAGYYSIGKPKASNDSLEDYILTLRKLNKQMYAQNKYMLQLREGFENKYMLQLKEEFEKKYIGISSTGEEKEYVMIASGPIIKDDSLD